MYFSLNKNGEEVDFFGAFDDIVVVYLVKWDAGYGGRYGVTVEMEDETAFAKAVQAVFAYLLEHYE